MKRWMAIDYGEKKVGIALTDRLKIMAQPFDTLHPKDNKDLIASIIKIIGDEEVEKIIVGLPINMDGSMSQAARTVNVFVHDLSQAVTTPVETWDERLTTVEAERILIEEANMQRKKRKKVIDKLAACLILKSYLEKHKP